MPIVNLLLDVTLSALLFDFIGSLADETSEDNYNVQVPTVWRLCKTFCFFSSPISLFLYLLPSLPAFVDGEIVKLFCQLYMILPQNATEKVDHSTDYSILH